MKKLINQIDSYLDIQEKKERISLSLNVSKELNDIIEFIKKSKDKEQAILMFNEEIQKEIKKFIEGGIL